MPIVLMLILRCCVRVFLFSPHEAYLSPNKEAWSNFCKALGSCQVPQEVYIMLWYRVKKVTVEPMDGQADDVSGS